MVAKFVHANVKFSIMLFHQSSLIEFSQYDVSNEIPLYYANGIVLT